MRELLLNDSQNFSVRHAVGHPSVQSPVEATIDNASAIDKAVDVSDMRDDSAIVSHLKVFEGGDFSRSQHSYM